MKTSVTLLLGLAILALTSPSPSASAQRQAQAATPPSAVPGATDSLLMREVFTYQAAGRRDPFVSLAGASELRPLITDLKLVGILTDPSGRRSVAILRDLTDAKKQYRVTVGSTLGRMRVTRITSRDVTFTLEELGRDRQEVLSYSDSTRTRTP